mgnify:CR=1 FL=1
MVRLLQRAIGASRVFCHCFNPTMVRLLLISWDTNWRNWSVSIPQWCDCCYIHGCICYTSEYSFNPTMVRLLPVTLPSPTLTSSFNPTMVRLLQHYLTEQFLALLGFNPTMVRLLLRHAVSRWHAVSVFQSHNGAIAAKRFHILFTSPFCFNPTMVRLLRE